MQPYSEVLGIKTPIDGFLDRMTMGAALKNCCTQRTDAASLSAVIHGECDLSLSLRLITLFKAAADLSMSNWPLAHVKPTRTLPPCLPVIDPCGSLPTSSKERIRH